MATKGLRINNTTAVQCLAWLNFLHMNVLYILEGIKFSTIVLFFWYVLFSWMYSSWCSILEYPLIWYTQSRHLQEILTMHTLYLKSYLQLIIMILKTDIWLLKSLFIYRVYMESTRKILHTGRIQFKVLTALPFKFKGF